MITVYGRICPTVVNSDSITLTYEGTDFVIGLHWLDIISKPSLSDAEQEALFWELHRKPKQSFEISYNKRQLKDVWLYTSEPKTSWLDKLQAEASLLGVMFTSDKNLATYELVLPVDYSHDIIEDLTLPRIVICFGFHGVRIAPLLFSPLGVDTYKERSDWVMSFCFTNYKFMIPTNAEVAWAALMLKKQVVDFTLERAGYQYTPEICSLIKFQMNADIA